MSKSGSLGSASSLMRVPSVSTPRSCVPSAEKVTFSILSPLTSFRKSEYRTSTGAPPRDWMMGTWVDCSGAAGGMSAAIERWVVRAVSLVGGAKALADPMMDPMMASVENFIIVDCIVIDQ